MLDAALSAPDHALHQDPAFASALKLCGQTPVTLPGGLTLLSRRLFGVRVAMLPRADPPPDLSAQLASAGLARTPLILSPETPGAKLDAIRLRAAMTTTTINLLPDTQTRRTALHSKWRNQLCRAEISPLRVSDAPLRPNHPLLRLEEQQARARRYVNWPRSLTSAFAHAARDQTRLFTAYLYGAPVAHMLFLLHGTRATYHIGHTTPDGRAHHAHNLLLWQASCWLAKTGHRSLDLGLLHDDTPNLNRFKLRTGAQTQLTGGTWLRWRPLTRNSRR